MKLLITGARGQLGSELRRCLETMHAEIGAIPSIYADCIVNFVDHDDLDIVDTAAVNTYFKEHGPYDVVINCAAYTNVDGCEQNEDLAFAVNATGVENLAKACQAYGAKFVHVSTDYVFSGNNPIPRTEKDPTNPISAYGRTKLAGEQLALAACEKTFIVRTAWLYGYIGRNFVKTMLRLACDNGAIAVVGDQYGNPTNANDLAYEILRIAETVNYGIYHCTNEGTCSWFDLASAAVDLADIPCVKESLTSDEYKKRFPNSASRPAYSGLHNKHLEETIGNEMRPWKEALASYIGNLSKLGD